MNFAGGSGSEHKGPIRGLGLRLRLCAHYGLLGQHTQGVFKVYAPGTSGAAATSEKATAGGVGPSSEDHACGSGRCAFRIDFNSISWFLLLVP